MTTHIKFDVHGTPMVARHRRGGWPLICNVAAAAFCIALSAASAFAAAGEPNLAECAIRWNAHEGGPKTGVEALAVLKARTRRASTFKVDYYDLPSTTTTAPGFSAILRRRIDHAGHANLTWKLRGNHALAGWTCPLRNSGKTKVEEWQLPGNVLMIEVSGSDTNTRDAMERFRTRVAVPLLAAGIVPSVNSKTELGSRCQ